MTPFRSGQQDSRTPSKAEIYSKLAAGARAAKLRSSSGEAPASPASPTDVERRGASGSSFSDSAADGAVIDWDEPETPASGYTSAVATPTAPQTPIVYADAEGDVDKFEYENTTKNKRTNGEADDGDYESYKEAHEEGATEEADHGQD